MAAICEAWALRAHCVLGCLQSKMERVDKIAEQRVTLLNEMQKVKRNMAEQETKMKQVRVLPMCHM